MADDTADPAGKETAKSREAGPPQRATRRAAKTRARKPDLDERNERMVGPRKPMGPPLQESTPSAAARRASARSRVKATDPETPSPAPRRASRKAKASTRRRRSSKTRKPRRR
jgi:hypothetical protein